MEKTINDDMKNIFAEYTASLSRCASEYASSFGMDVLENYLKAPENMMKLIACSHDSFSKSYVEWCEKVAFPYLTNLQKEKKE